MNNSRSIKSACSTTSTRNGWPNDDPFATPHRTPHYNAEFTSPLAFEGAAEVRSVRSVRSMHNTRNGWSDDMFATGLPTTRDDELVSPLVWQRSSHLNDFLTSPTSARSSVRTVTPFFTPQSTQNRTGIRPTTPVTHPSPLAPVHGRDSFRSPQFPHAQYRNNSRPTTPLAHSNTSLYPVANSIVPAVGEYYSPTVRSRTVSNLSPSLHNQDETNANREITITTTTTISLPPTYNPAVLFAPVAPPSQGTVVHRLNEGVFPESRHYVDPLDWSLTTIGALSGRAENEGAFSAVPSENGGAKLQRAGRHARPAKGHRVRRESHLAPSQGGPLADIHVTAPAAQPLDRQPRVLAKSRLDRRLSRSSSDLEALARADGYSRYALPAHGSVVAINSSNVEAEGKKPTNGSKKGGMLKQLLRSNLKVPKRW